MEEETMEEETYECYCGKRLPTLDSLRRHAAMTGCRKQNVGVASRSWDNPFIYPSQVAASRAQAEEERLEAEKSKRKRKQDHHEERRKHAALKLAQLRYVKLVPGAHVDQFRRG